MVVLSHYKTIQTIAHRMVQDMLVVVWWLVLMDHLLLCVIILPFLSTLLDKLVINESDQQVSMHTLHSVSPSVSLTLSLSFILFIFKIILFSLIISSPLSPPLSPLPFLSLFFFTDYTIVPFDPLYLNGDTNLVINNCSNTPMYSSGYTYCDNTVRDGTCSNGSPLIVRCEAG